jgi:hypothetical protein
MRFRSTRVALTAALVISGVSAKASAGLVASDSYATGSSPLAGQYVPYIAGVQGSLNAQPSTLTNTGFANGGYNSGTGTGNFVASATGLISSVDGADSTTGSVAWIGAPVDNANRSVARNLSAFTEGTTGTYWTSILVSNAGTQTSTNGYVLSGFGGTVAPVAPGVTASGFLQGIFIGFADDTQTAGEADLVIRSRDTTGNKTDQDTTLVSSVVNNQSYLVVAQINVNPGGGSQDTVNYWVNPADLNSVADLNATSLAQGSFNTYSFQGSATGVGDFTRLNYDAVNWDGQSYFDQAALGTTLASIAPTLSGSVPEPASIAMTALGCGFFALGSYWRNRRSSR